MSLVDNVHLKIMKEISIVADGDDFMAKAKEMGKRAKEIFKDKHKSQMRNLENVSNSAYKVTDIFNYIKRQTGKDRDNNNWSKNSLGKDLLRTLMTIKEEKGNQIYQSLSLDDPEDRLSINLSLIREFVFQMVVHYEFLLQGGAEGEGFDSSQED